MQLRLDPHDRYYLAHIDGLVSLEAWDQVLQELAHAIAPLQHDRMLVDLSGLVGWLGLPERTAVGRLMATHLARLGKVALVIEASKITGAVEGEARRNGLDLRLFSDGDEAAAWVVT
ncbi:MAG: STAS/SEC14 domain-containing protein [Ramlibacter sp.]|nr:STAS/SEC14 domain-containing protein [Ramlibacter sp.]